MSISSRSLQLINNLMSESISVSGAFSNPFLLMYPSFTEPLTIFCNNAFSAAQSRISKDTELKREHILAFILTFISGWKNLTPMETLVPPFILGKNMLSDISTASSLAILPRMEAFTLEFLSAPNIPTFITVLYLEMLRQLISNLADGGAFPPQSKLPGFLALMLGDGRRRVVSVIQDMLSIIARYEVELLEDDIKAATDGSDSDTDAVSGHTQHNTKSEGMHTPGYCSIQIISSLISMLSTEGAMNVTKMVLYNLRTHDTSLSDGQLSLAANLVYAASGGSAVYHSEEGTDMSAGCMLVIRLLQLLFVPDMSASALNVLGGILSSDTVIDVSLLSLIESSFRELPIDRDIVNRTLLIYETVAFYLSRKILESASGANTFQTLERLFDYFVIFLKQLKAFFKMGANSEIVQRSLSLMCMSIFTHHSIVTGRLLPAFEKAINAITSTIDPVNAESFFEKVGTGFAGIAEGCFLLKQDEQQEYEEVIAGLKGLFAALVAGARHTENQTCIFIITSFIKRLDLKLAFKAFNCGLISDDGHSTLTELARAPSSATDLWLLSYYSKCKSASLSFIYTHLFEGILNQSAFKRLETGIRSILLDQLWTIVSEVTRNPVADDFLGYSSDTSVALAEASTKASVDTFCSILIDNLFGSTDTESRAFHACGAAMGNLLRFFSTLQCNVMKVVESILKAPSAPHGANLTGESSASTDICTSLMELITKSDSFQLSDTVIESLRLFEASLSFVGGFLVPKLLSPLLDHMLAVDCSNNNLYTTLLPLAVSLAKKPLVSTACTNVIKRIIAGTGPQVNLFDVFNGIISGCIAAKNFSPLGHQTVPVFLELDSKLSALHSISAQKLHYKILRFLVNVSSSENPELAQAILSSIEAAGTDTFRGGALQRHRFGLYADIVRSSDVFNLEPSRVLSEFARDIYLCLSDNNMRVRHTASEMLKAATVKACRQCCNDESLGSLKMNIYAAVQKISDCLQPPQDSSFDVWTSYAYLLQIIMIGMTEVVRKLLVEDLNILLEKNVNISEFNCTHPLFITTANQILTAIETNLSLEKRKVSSTDAETGEETTEFAYRYTLSLPTISARRLLNFFSAFISAAGPSELLSMAEEIPRALLRLVIGSLTSPYRSVVKNILFQLGLAMGYSYSRDLYEEAFNFIIKDMMEYIVTNSETPINNLDPEILVAIRDAAAEACVSARRMVSAVLSKLRHKASDQMVGRFTLPNYMDVALSIPEDMHGRIRSYTDDVDFTDIYKRIVDGNEEPVDLEEKQHHSDSPREVEDPFTNNKKFGKSLNSAMAMLLDETVERDTLRPEHIQKLAQIKENDAILNRTLAEIKKINQRRQYSSGKLKVVHTGHEFSSKRAGGDVRDVNKADPYAYLPLLTGKHISKQDRTRLKAGMALVTQKRTRDERIAKKQMLSHAEKRAMMKHGHIPPNLRNKRHNKKR